jgi:low affinity Fe/Cu permease
MADNRGTGRRSRSPHMPSDVTPNLSLFDRFATTASTFVSRAWFFTLCLLLVVVWLPSYFLLPDLNTWQLIINTITTIVTFLLVALLQNTQTRQEEAIQHKLNAIADGLADLMAALGEDKQALRKDRAELRKAVGLEDRESS